MTPPLRLVALLAVCLTQQSCAVQLTPDSLMKSFTAIKNANQDLTPENEYFVGRSVATNLLARHNYQYRDAGALAAGRLEGITEYVSAVGQLLAAAAIEAPGKEDRPSPIAGWHFTVIEDAVINAFAAPGGYIFVTTGAVRAAASEDELAAILAHEVAHVARGHALGSIKKSRWAGVAKETLDNTVKLDEQALGDLTKVFEGAMDDMVDALLVKGYSRDTEFEADGVGLRIMARAGYDPRAFTRYLETLRGKQGSGKGGFFATHPGPGDRIGKLRDANVRSVASVAAISARTQRFTRAVTALR